MSRLNQLTTELRNEQTKNIDNMTTKEVLEVINNEDDQIPKAVAKVLPEVEQTVHAVVQAFRNDGRLFYVGAGTSGRIGILDAVECPPTFSTPSHLVQGIIAGGKEAIEHAVEGAEDDESLGKRDLQTRNLAGQDVVVGIAASGRTPYVKGALQYAKQIGATTVSLTSNQRAAISEFADIAIEVVTGPEILTGSTRMKAATAHKQILNMITTTSMIKIGKVYENLMVDLKVSNEKLLERAINIITTVTKASYDQAKNVLCQANYEVKPAIVMIKTNASYQEAISYIERANGYVRDAIQMAQAK